MKNEIYWIPLKINLISLINREVDNIIKIFFEYKEKARNNIEDYINKLEILKINIKARIKDFEIFFKNNFFESNIYLFEKEKLRLKKLWIKSDINNENFESELPLYIEDDKTNKDHSVILSKSSSGKKNIMKTDHKLNSNKKYNNKIYTTGKKDNVYRIKMTKDEYNELIKKRNKFN